VDTTEEARMIGVPYIQLPGTSTIDATKRTDDEVATPWRIAEIWTDLIRTSRRRRRPGYDRRSRILVSRRLSCLLWVVGIPRYEMLLPPDFIRKRGPLTADGHAGISAHRWRIRVGRSRASRTPRLPGRSSLRCVFHLGKMLRKARRSVTRRTRQWPLLRRPIQHYTIR